MAAENNVRLPKCCFSYLKLMAYQISATKLQTYHRCPQAYQFRYELGLKTNALDFLQKSLKLTQFLADEAHSCTIQL
jgi:ATP-dependent helicase/DNAse subunit B